MAADDTPFIFPTRGPLPHRDADAGMAFQSGGVRGVYQVGVIHGLVMSGYYPRTIGGTSVGSLSGAILAFASEIDDQHRRMELVDEALATWERDPTADAIALLRDGSAGRLVADLVDVDLTLGELLGFAGEVLRPAPAIGKIWPLLRLWWAFPLELRLRVADAGLVELLRGGGADGLALRVVQRVLDAYGMPASLLPVGPVDRWFGHLIERYAPRGAATTFEDLKRSDLVFQIANLSRQRRILTLGKRTDTPAPGTLAGGRLATALRAASSFSPLFAPVRLGDIVDRLPPTTGVAEEALAVSDLVMDAADIAKDALDPVMSRWTSAGHERARRLFAAYHSPLGPTEGHDDSPFFGPALRSLELRDDLDLTYNADVITLITGMIEDLRAAGKAPPRRAGREGPYVPVHMSSIAPRRRLPVAEIASPEPGEMLAAAALGCRGALEALHEATIRALGGDLGKPVACAQVLAAVRDGQEDRHLDGYFEPLPRLCAACDAKLEPVFRQQRRPTRKTEAANDFAPFHRPHPLTIVVPAGGVFLGVFQFGSIAALKQYGIEPDLYAGASVGTIFSYLLQATLRGGTLDPVVALATTLPDWIDKGPEGTMLVDSVVDEVSKRWGSEALAGLRALRPRQVVDLFTTEALPPDRSATWLTFQAGIDALLFTPMNRHGKPVRPLGEAYRLLPGDRDELRRMLANLARNRLPAVLAREGERPAPLDRIAANLDLYTPGSAQDGEILGFTSIEEQLRKISFGGKGDGAETLSGYSASRSVRFIFTVTNHTEGMLEYLGYDDGVPPELRSPHAVQAALAASSFPLAFRRRTRREVFGPGTELPDTLYADGGIFNNFPSDAAFAYLRDLTDQEETRWIGGLRHNVLLLSLTSPPKSTAATGTPQGLVATSLRSLSMGEDEKVEKTLRSQEHVNTVAAAANPVLAAVGKRQAIRAEMELIAPTYTIYDQPFALKPYLGFTVDKELEMLASGCRRARITLEWGAYQDASPGADPAALEARFTAELKDAVSGPHAPNECVFGRFSPKRPEPVCCPFAGGAMDSVFACCKKTVDTELAVPDLKLSRRLRPP